MLPGAVEQNNTLHVMDNQSRIALVRVGQPSTNDTTPAVKYHLGDHLGSSNLVVDDAGSFVNREEYTPYGETSFGSFARKRYRFSGKERDEESGLNYHGARYYASWLGRWTSCDPIGLVDGTNLYVYARNNPIINIDSAGMQAGAPDQARPAVPVGSVEVDPHILPGSTQEHVNLSDMVVAAEKPFEPEVSDPQALRQAEDQGRITSASLKQFGKSVADPVGRWALEKVLGPYGPLVVPLLPKSKVAPREGGADLIGTAVGIGVTMGFENAAPNMEGPINSLMAALPKGRARLKTAAMAPLFMFMGAGGPGGWSRVPSSAGTTSSRLRAATFRPVTTVEQAALDEGAKVIKQKGTYSEAGDTTHEALGAAGHGEGVDFKGKGWIMELKTHWTGFASEFELTKATEQSMVDAAKYQGDNGGLSPIRIVKHLYWNPSGGNAVKLVGK